MRQESVPISCLMFYQKDVILTVNVEIRVKFQL
jgi:hypothetical protein